MKNNTAINYEDIRKDIFTKKQLVQLDKRLKAKIVLRKLKQEMTENRITLVAR